MERPKQPSSPSCYFVTGTDTGVGKTFVTVALARRARELGRRVFAFKPIETGCARVEADRARVLVGSDMLALREAAGGWQRGPLEGVYRFELPAAPLVAAEAARTSIDLDVVARVFEDGRRAAELTLVEGAGGWRVPITPSADMAVLAARIGAPVIVVARAGLGTINHSLLSVEAVERDGLQVAAVVLSLRPNDEPTFAQSNADQIARVWKGRVIVFDGTASQLDPLL